MPAEFLRRRWAVCAICVIVVGAGAAVGARSGGAAAPAARQSSKAIAQALLDHGRARFGTQAVRRALEFTAGLPQSPGLQVGGPEGQARQRPATGGSVAPPPRLGLANVRVNDPSADHFQVDQTTQSETSLAVAGSNVAVGFNDSQQALLGFTDGLDFSGYAYSTNGGQSFTDGGALPNPLNFVNFGDPWLTSDRSGRMYYSTLTFGGDVGNLEVAVAHSTNGGKTWTEPTIASPNNDGVLYLGDKDAVTSGRDPQRAGRDNVYVAWDDFAFDPANNSQVAGLPLARSTDGGTTWSLHYADKITIGNDPKSCSFGQYIGAQPLVDPATGTLYLAAEKIVVDDPHCIGTMPVFSEVIFKSSDAGTTFDHGTTVASVTSASPVGALELGPGLFVRTIEFPVLAMRAGTLWLAWNDGGTGRSHIRLATSTDNGATWGLSSVTNGSGDEIQPAISVDSAGLHIAYYQRNANNTLDTVVADSTDNGVHFAAKTITSRSFPGVRTVPQFDPLIGFGYMGDYISVVSSAGRQYFAWGDNRDRITNFTHPNGRNDPDVFFARR